VTLGKERSDDTRAGDFRDRGRDGHRSRGDGAIKPKPLGASQWSFFCVAWSPNFHGHQHSNEYTTSRNEHAHGDEYTNEDQHTDEHRNTYEYEHADEHRNTYGYEHANQHPNPNQHANANQHTDEHPNRYTDAYSYQDSNACGTGYFGRPNPSSADANDHNLAHNGPSDIDGSLWSGWDDDDGGD
jgi:hypothetical protein